MNKADCIFELKWLRGVYAGMRKEYGSCVEALDMAINALEQTAWIPCSERLPEGNLYVLVTYKYQYGLMDIGITWYSERENKWCDARPIIAWMPLPAPYKEDAE